MKVSPLQLVIWNWKVVEAFSKQDRYTTGPLCFRTNLTFKGLCLLCFCLRNCRHMLTSQIWITSRRRTLWQHRIVSVSSRHTKKLISFLRWSPVPSISSGKIIKSSDLKLFWEVALNFAGPCCLVLATSLVETVFHLRHNNDGDQVLWAPETEHPTQTLVLTKIAGYQPGWGHCFLRSSVASSLLFATLETRGELDPKCVTQLLFGIVTGDAPVSYNRGIKSHVCTKRRKW